MSDDPDLETAYALETPDDSRRLYANWAETYDTDFVAANGYVLHVAVAEAFHAAGGSGPVLDLGAGTGLCGQVLAHLGAGPIDGTDISPQMLAQAKSKAVYARLFEGDILAELPVPEASYPGIVSSGTFTLGHVGPDGLDEVARLLAPGGLAVIAVRDTHFTDAGFEAKLAALEPVLRCTKCLNTRIYAENAPGDYAGDMAFLLHLEKI